MALTEKEIIEKLKQVAELYEPTLLKGPLDKWGNGLNSYDIEKVDRELGKMYEDVVGNNYGSVNEGILSRFLQYINKIADEHLKYVLYCGIMRYLHFLIIYDFHVSVDASYLLTNLFKRATTTKYSTVDDKIICMHHVYDQRIMESALAMLRKRIDNMFVKNVGGILDFRELEDIIKLANKLKDVATMPEKGKVLEATKLYNKDGYKEKIEKEFSKEAILAKFNNEYPQTRGLPEWMVQGVIPGTEKDINYEEQSEQVETPKQPEPIQSTLIELQQEEQIADLKKRLNEQSKQYEKTSQEQARGLQEKEAELKKMKSKVEQFSDASDYLQQQLDEQIQKTDEAEQKANKLQEELNKIMNMGMFEFMKYKKAK